MFVEPKYYLIFDLRKAYYIRFSIDGLKCSDTGVSFYPINQLENHLLDIRFFNGNLRSDKPVLIATGLDRLCLPDGGINDYPLEFHEWFIRQFPKLIDEVEDLDPEVVKKYSQIRLMSKFGMFNGS